MLTRQPQPTAQAHSVTTTVSRAPEIPAAAAAAKKVNFREATISQNLSPKTSAQHLEKAGNHKFF